jgi:hypothetical protein
MCSYLESAGGAWDEVEPQVYDVLVPSPEEGAAGGEIVRVTFDPEALPEHPGAQLASFGTPFIDRLLRDAVRRGRSGLAYLVGLHLAPHDLAARCRRALTLPAKTTLQLARVRALHFTQAAFWFQAEFVSDQKEQEIVPLAVDLHHGREVRHLDKLLERSRLAAEPALPLPEARRAGVAEAFRLARDQVLRTVAGLAHGRARALGQRLEQQISRLRQYYDDLAAELGSQAPRGRDAEEAATRLRERREALVREQRLRVAELTQKSVLRVELRLLQVLLIQQPKLLARAEVVTASQSALPLELIWDPLTEALEPPTCPACGHPTFTLDVGRQGRLHCPDGHAEPSAPSARRAPR